MKRKGDGENCEDLGVCETLHQTMHRNESESIDSFIKYQRMTGTVSPNLISMAFESVRMDRFEILF